MARFPLGNCTLSPSASSADGVGVGSTEKSNASSPWGISSGSGVVGGAASSSSTTVVSATGVPFSSTGVGSATGAPPSGAGGIGAGPPASGAAPPSPVSVALDATRSLNAS